MRKQRVREESEFSSYLNDTFIGLRVAGGNMAINCKFTMNRFRVALSAISIGIEF